MIELCKTAGCPGGGLDIKLQAQNDGMPKKNRLLYSIHEVCSRHARLFLLPKSFDDPDINNGSNRETKVDVELIRHLRTYSEWQGRMQTQTNVLMEKKAEQSK